jgi:hypothetical protein
MAEQKVGAANTPISEIAARGYANQSTYYLDKARVTAGYRAAWLRQVLSVWLLTERCGIPAVASLPPKIHIACGGTIVSSFLPASFAALVEAISLAERSAASATV